MSLNKEVGEDLLPESLQRLEIQTVVEAEGQTDTKTTSRTLENIPERNPFYGEELIALQKQNTEVEGSSSSDRLDNGVLVPQSFSDLDISVRNSSSMNDFLFVLKQSDPCLKCQGGSSGLSLEEENLYNDLIKCNCGITSNLSCGRRKDTRLEDIFQKKKSIFKTSLERADRKWTFFSSKPSQVILNRRFKSNLRSTILREPILKLKPFQIEQSPTSFTSRFLSMDEFRTRYRSDLQVDNSKKAVSDVFDLKSLDPETNSCENPAPSTSSSSANLQQMACSQQARLNCDVTMDELASYFDCFVYIPKKMSTMAEMMYN